MKIALFHNLGSGGAKRALFEHARLLQDLGHDLDLYTTSAADESFLPLSSFCRAVRVYPGPDFAAPRAQTGSGRSFVARAGARLNAVRVLRGHRELWNRLDRLYCEIAEEINGGGYDLAYVHHCRFILSPAILKHVKTPSVYYCQDTLRDAHEWSPQADLCYDTVTESLFRRVARGQVMTVFRESLLRHKDRRNTANARAATLVLANSYFSREAIWRTMGINARVCRLGVDTTFFRPPAGDARERSVLSVGSLTPAKRHEFVVDSVAMIPERERPYVRVVGNYPSSDLAGLRTWINNFRAFAIDRSVRVDILADISEEALREEYQSAGVVALAPALEPFGLVALEAMASGSPIVAVAEGGLRESIIDGKTGILTDRDRSEFAQGIRSLLTDRARAELLGRNGRQHVESQWTWKRSGEQLLRLFENALTCGPSTRLDA